MEPARRETRGQILTYRHSFFTDPTISTLTSGTPSQNVDLGSLSFPRRLGVRLHTDFIKRYHLTGMQAKWMSFEDPDFKTPMGKDFYHEDMITREGWANYYFKGKYPKDVAYIRCQIVNSSSGMLLQTFYFKFQKSYQTSLDARYYITDPVLGNKIVKNGILTELRPMKNSKGGVTYRPGQAVFTQEKLTAQDVVGYDLEQFDPKDVKGSASHNMTRVSTPAIVRTNVRYCETPKMVFLVTPPHLISGANPNGGIGRSIVTYAERPGTWRVVILSGGRCMAMGKLGGILHRIRYRTVVGYVMDTDLDGRTVVVGKFVSTMDRFQCFDPVKMVQYGCLAVSVWLAVISIVMRVCA